MDEADEFGDEVDVSSEPITERVRIYGAEIAGEFSSDRGRSNEFDEEMGASTSGSVEDRFPGFTDDGDDSPVGPASLHSSLEEREGPAWSTHGEVHPYLPGEPSGAVPVMPHWSDPPTGQVPAVVARHDDENRSESWSQSGPSWREHDHEWDDGGFEPSMLGDDETRMGALDETPLSERRPWEFGDLSSPHATRHEEESDSGSTRRSAWSETAGRDSAAAGAWWEDDASHKDFWDDDAEQRSGSTLEVTGDRPATSRLDETREQGSGPSAGHGETSFVASISSSPLRASSPARRGSSTAGHRLHRRRPARPNEAEGGGSGRNVPIAIATGIVFVLVALACFALGSVASLVLSTVVVTLAAAECYAALRRAGRRPATLLGLVATVGVMVSVYAKGIAALPLVLVLVVVTSMIWYLSGAERGSPLEGITTTVLGFAWVGLLGSFAALMLAPSQYPHRHGVAFLFGAVVATVAADVGALAFGGWLGRHPLAPRVSPRKTWEGLFGGAVLAVLASAAITGQVHPWTPGKAALLGLVVAVVAPVGDLCESLIKRDLGLKDMGSLLPGHGGLLDRVDALLFVLPATYYLVRVLHLG